MVGETVRWVRSLSNGTIPVSTNPCGMPTPAVLEVGERMKVSIVFALPNEPLALLKAISVFALRDINVSKIESRPASATGDQFATAYHWDYVFYMDLELPARYGFAPNAQVFTCLMSVALTPATRPQRCATRPAPESSQL